VRTGDILGKVKGCGWGGKGTTEPHCVCRLPAWASLQHSYRGGGPDAILPYAHPPVLLPCMAVLCSAPTVGSALPPSQECDEYYRQFMEQEAARKAAESALQEATGTCMR
jgi:hypothetical protein